MPVVWNAHIVVRPRELLLRELHWGGDELPRFATPHLWLVPSVGDHDYEGQHANAITWMKLVFLAKLHASARREPSRASTSFDAQQEAEAKEAARLIAGKPLNEAFFDARWTVEDIGIFVDQYDFAAYRLDEKDLRAVTGPDTLVRSRMQGGDRPLREDWARFASSREKRQEEWESFVHVSALRLARRFELSTVHLRHDPGLVRPEKIAALLGDELTLDRTSNLSLRVEFERRWEYSLSYCLLESQIPGRRRRATREQGQVFGVRSVGEPWDLSLETRTYSKLD
ncbi:MAG: hypothetical protein AAGE52_29555 [Myxococcota bacterium]